MEPKGLLLCSQEPATCCLSMLDHMNLVHALASCFLKIHFNVICCMLRYTHGIFPSSVPTKPSDIFILHVNYMQHPSDNSLILSPK